MLEIFPKWNGCIKAYPQTVSQLVVPSVRKNLTYLQAKTAKNVMSVLMKSFVQVKAEVPIDTKTSYQMEAIGSKWHKENVHVVKEKETLDLPSWALPSLEIVQIVKEQENSIKKHGQ